MIKYQLMNTKQILNKYINFYLEKGHKLIPNVSLVPQGDSTLLFVNSGMFPLVPYLSGQTHPLGNKLVNVQRALRLEDIDEIGDKSHTLGFHMIGNWSLGDYFKDKQLPWAYEFLIEELGLDIKRIVATVFKGDELVQKDNQSIEILKNVFKKYGCDLVENKNIFAYGKKENWWQRGDAVGELGGPDSEIHYYLGSGDFVELGKNPLDNEEEFLEIGNSVFMQYKKTANGWQELDQKNVDFGGGLERLAWVSQNKNDIFETDNYWSIIKKIQELTGKNYIDSEETKRLMRIVADHIKICVLLVMDGVSPSNKDQGYILRRLLRRLTRFGMQVGITKDVSLNLVDVVVQTYSWLYPQLQDVSDQIKVLFDAEEKKFIKTLNNGQIQTSKLIKQNNNFFTKDWAKVAFELYQSMGYPHEMFLQDLSDNQIKINNEDFYNMYDRLAQQHQSQSRQGSDKKFKGGLADHSDIVIKYHTATHLIQAGLKKILSKSVSQAGSNITNQRARFDFYYDQKITDQQVNQVENFVNQIIKEGLNVNETTLDKQEAIDKNVTYLQNESYPDLVKVYYIGNSLEECVSKEFCGGPHVSNTKELPKVEIYKVENIGEGKKRIYFRFK